MKNQPQRTAAVETQIWISYMHKRCIGLRMGLGMYEKVQNQLNGKY